MAKRVSRPQLVFLRLRDSNPREVYAGLLWMARSRGYKPGFVDHKFRAIFGWDPLGYETIEPEPPHTDLVSWLGAQKMKFKNEKNRKREKASKALDRIEAILAEIEALDTSLGGLGRDPTDSEPKRIVERIERRRNALAPRPRFIEAAE